jgi:hypothetical protein
LANPFRVAKARRYEKIRNFFNEDRESSLEGWLINRFVLALAKARRYEKIRNFFNEDRESSSGGLLIGRSV